MEIRIVGKKEEVEALILLLSTHEYLIEFTYDGNLVPRHKEPGRVAAYLNNVWIWS